MARPTYRIDAFRIGPMDNFGYLLIDEASGRAATVDPAWDAAIIQARADALGVRIDTVLLTHTHHDHVSAIDAFLSHPVHLAAAEAPVWPDTPSHATLHEDGDVLTLGETRLTWHVTPGHSPGSSCLVLERDALTADTLFVYGCGRCDLEGSDPAVMHASLTRLKTLLPPDTIIHPGHDYGIAPNSTMAEQLAGNPFLMFEDRDAFVQYRMVDHSRLRSQPYGPERSPYPD